MVESNRKYVNDESWLLAGGAVEAAGARSPAIGAECLVTVRDPVLEDFKLNSCNGNTSENQLQTRMLCIAKHLGGNLKRGWFQALADAWQLHLDSEYVP